MMQRTLRRKLPCISKNKSTKEKIMNKLTFEEFKANWFSKTNAAEQENFISEELALYFCECDYKRYTGEWVETL